MKAKRILAGFLAAGMLAGYALVPDAGKAFNVVASAAGDVAINATNFPDATFREYVSTNFDTNPKDGSLSQAECEAVTAINVAGVYLYYDGNVTSMKGIEYFPNLKTLKCGDNVGITELDVSKNTALEYLDCDEINISKLDISQNIALNKLHCVGTNITELDVSNNTALTVLYCGSNGITELDVSNNLNLKTLSFFQTKISDIDISMLSSLTYLDFTDTNIVDIDLSQNVNLTFIRCYYNSQLTSLDLSHNVNLTNLECHTTNVSALDLSKNIKLTSLRCFKTKIENLNLSKNTALTELMCQNNQLSSLDLSKNIDLEYLDCCKNNITELDLTQNTKLTFLCCDARVIVTGSKVPNKNDDGSVPEGSLLVWANGKDIKDDPKTADVDETHLYRTASYQNVGKFSGGKWCVAVTPEEINTAAKFTSLFDERGKLTSDGKTQTGNAKKLAKAKIKDGKVTVTAGKEAGTVQVWVYELKNKKIVVDDTLGIAPVNKTVYVRMAAGSPVFAEAADLTDGVLPKGKKAVTKTTLLYKNGADSQDSVTIAFGDKKAAYHSTATFTTEIKEGTNAAAEVSLGRNEITVTPTKAGKASVTLKNVQSSKTAKLAVTVVNAYKVTVPAGAAVKYKSGKDYVTVNDGDYAPTKAKLEITASGKTIKVNGTAVKSGKFTVGDTAVVITLE